MKRFSSIALAFLILVLTVGSAVSRDAARPGMRPMRAESDAEATFSTDPGLLGLYQESAVDTYCIVWYDFESFNWQGWTRQDWTAQIDTFFHVDDFAGLGGGDFGRLVPLEGSKSMWCGARPNLSDPYMCRWSKAPGYGNSWDQMLTTDAMSLTGAVTLSYELSYDCEDDYDYAYVEYDAGSGNWKEVASYNGSGTTVGTSIIYLAQARTKLRFHFVSDGAWSDEDGLWNTDGGCIVDSIRVADSGGYIDFEDFEGAPVGALDAGIWHARPLAGFGLYSGLWYNLRDYDPCGDNFGTQVVFFVGSTVPSSSYPGLYDTPFCKGATWHDAPCQEEYVVSPIIDLKKYSTGCNAIQDGTIPPGDLPQLGGALVRYTVMADLPLPNLVFHNWYIRSIKNGCPRGWNHDDIFYGPYGEYTYMTKDVGRFITGDSVQIAVGIRDMCDIFYLSVGNCATHTPSPWYDNVRLYRYKTSGPQWGYRALDLFQDNFPGNEFDIESFVRADAANDLRPNSWPGIDPGDSIAVDCASPLGGGIDTMPNGYPAVYLHVRCSYVGGPPAKPALAGPQLQGTYGLYVSDDGTWTIIQGDYARTQAGTVRDKYMFDLNDSLFTRGYLIEYYFTALDNAGEERALPKYARSGAPYFEFTCLPTQASDVLFVKDYGRYYPPKLFYDLEIYWNSVFRAVLPSTNQPDRYDVLDAASAASNGPGSRAKTQQLVDNYRTIIWDSGDLQDATITDGTVNSDKSNDCQMLIDWMNNSTRNCGLWVCGDEIAYDLTVNDNLSTPARTLLQTWCGTTLVNTSYFEVTGGRSGGGIVLPLITGDTAGVFVHGGVPDRFLAAGGCPIINQFECLGKMGNGEYALDYPDYESTKYYAGIQARSLNSHGDTVSTMWFGFSYQYVRDDTLDSPPLDRFEIAGDVLGWLKAGPTNPDVTHAEAPGAYRLGQNYPNPFNPVTEIKYGMKEKGPVTIKVYDVAGRLVRTLVEGVENAGSHGVAWDGRNNLGRAAANGIYFYKMEAAGFSATKKMVLLR